MDDNSELYLSTDDDPANSVMIAREDEWNGIRVWTGTAGDINQSPTNFPNGFNLQAGERYYFELFRKKVAVEIMSLLRGIPRALPLRMGTVTTSSPVIICNRPLSLALSRLQSIPPVHPLEKGASYLQD